MDLVLAALVGALGGASGLIVALWVTERIPRARLVQEKLVESVITPKGDVLRKQKHEHDFVNLNDDTGAWKCSCGDRYARKPVE